MAMFSEKKPGQDGPGTIVGANVRLSGTLKDSNDITIYGSVEGEVVSDKNVAVEKNAQIKGPVTAQTIIVAGKIQGEVKALERLEILETGKVSGSVTAKDLVIKSGATFNGKSKMGTEEKSSEKKTVATSLPTKKPDDKHDKKYELE